MQTRWQSFIESCVNIGIGYCIALVTQYFLFPIFDIQTNFREELMIAGVFTVISIIRSFLMRRFFNWYHVTRHLTGVGGSR